jgi:ABC-type multidrug transport system fused ATPase/permease subunit
MLQDKKLTRPPRQLFGVLWGYLKYYWKTLILVALVMVVYTAAATYQPILIQQAIDNLLGNESTSGPLDLQTLVTIFIVLSFAVWFLQSLSTWLLVDLRTQLINSIRVDAFKKIVRADLSYHHNNQSGTVTSRVVSDAESIASGLQVFTTTLTQLLLVVATFGVLVSINIWFAAISLIAIPVAIVVSKVFGTIGRRRMLATRQAFGNVQGKLAESLAGVSIAKSFNQEERVSADIEELNEESYQMMKNLILVFILVFPSITMVSTILVFGVLWLGGYLTLTTPITVGVIYLGTVMVQRFLRPIIQLSNNYTQLQVSLAAVDRIQDIIEANPAITNKADAVPYDYKGGKVEFDNVSFAYVEDELVLKNVNFTLEAGEKLALVGHTGAGKTTISSLLMRFYDPSKGTIRLDGQDLRDLTLNSITSNLSLVTQEPYLFASSVMENLRYGKPDATDEEILDLCTLIGADQFIEALPDGYDTVLQESGKSLSAGQRQMITIARTMLSDPKILILDEATSRLDAYSESLVQSAQKLLFKGRTTIIIAHRLSTIRDVEKILVLDGGELVEYGSHDQLISKQGKYAELYSTYYAHQGIGEIDAGLLDEKPSKHSETHVHLASLLEEKQEWYSNDLKIKLNGTTDELMLEAQYKSVSQLLDGFLGMVKRISEMHQSSKDVILSTIKENGHIELQLEYNHATIPEKMQTMMMNKDAPSRGPGPSLAKIVDDAGASFEIISPPENKDKGIILKAVFNQKLVEA